MSPLRNVQVSRLLEKTKDAKALDGDKIVAIGNATIRERIQKEIETVTLIHPDAVIGRRVRVEKGQL